MQLFKVSTPFIFLYLIGSSSCIQGESKTAEVTSVPKQEITSLKFENLLKDSLEFRENVDVVMSYLEVPKYTTLPRHYHPGEEYVYMLEGKGEFLLEGHKPQVLKAGQVVKVPFKKTHSFSTKGESVKAVIFRVHEKGEPERIMVK
ncbi:cupin domain-containing protein [Sediminitomix flava]|uniref:Quercetin dioxygenase-like cupin family protein n=1 Tax=Sediminitomix flava TaxID=379075 RepID=A0A315Z8E2_SEDFL|nr:cupin domain-containing protein [Sediminitomix flava]PWJ41835.1 quercetin dioxygenase-like cupin family protein [Sediminitomix flava]